ncbi:hypothetical protein [Paludisphaera rhizosphaerae]|uniref:hypothetical protein n=1 Tax=Paludisphaera rhizosphaerae TaxID=2711216 RepID=UPI0013EDB11C|nr:hypothetical protein [Paludisphaera rhizosphaerae]
MRLLVIDRGITLGSPEGHQAIPFHMYGRELKEQLGLTVDQVTAWKPAEVEAAVRERPADVALVLLDWALSPREAAEACDRMRAIPNGPRIAFMDHLDPIGSPFLEVAEHVDCYVKRQHLADPALYLKDYQGGHPFTHFLAETMGYDLGGWFFASKPGPTFADKLTTSWNLGVTPRYRSRLRVARRLRGLWRFRPFAIHQRFSPMPVPGKKREWYEQYRDKAAEILRPLASRYRMTGTGRVDHRVYLAELCASKVVVSPFGWGEVCFRDYETVVTGGLLVKPNMDHVVTRPNIYKAFETYVPVKWDLSDLVETCEYYLTHPKESMRIIANAQDALTDYYEKGGFVEDVQRLIEVATRPRVGEAVSTPAPPQS